MCYQLRFLSLAVSVIALTGNIGFAQNPVNEPTWISSVRWKSETELIGTQSQGLLFRPGKVVVAKAESPAQLTALAESETALWSIVNSGDVYFASDYKGRVLRIDGAKIQPLDLKARWIRSLTSIPGAPNELLAGTEDGQLIVFQAESGTELRKAALEPAAVFKACFNRQANQLALACGDGNIHLLTWPALEKTKTLKGTGAVWSLCFSQDEKQIISGGTDRKIRLWDIETAQSIVTIGSASDWITCLQPLGDTSYIVAGSMNGEVLLADYKTKLPVKNVKVAQSAVWDLASSPDGKRLAVATRKNGLQIVAIESWYDEARAAAKTAEAEQPPQPQQ